jgi:hypothetical protein
MRNNPEYQLYRQVSTYLRYRYPGVLYHFDPTGLNLSKAQSGMLKAIQGQKGYPDLGIFYANGNYKALFLELKTEGTKLYTKDGRPATPHIAEQQECLVKLQQRGYQAQFACGLFEAVKIIDDYLNE